jgi:hypothetical protein
VGLLGDVTGIHHDPSDGWVSKTVVRNCLKTPPMARCRLVSERDRRVDPGLTDAFAEERSYCVTIVGMDPLEATTPDARTQCEAEHVFGSGIGVEHSRVVVEDGDEVA